MLVNAVPGSSVAPSFFCSSKTPGHAKVVIGPRPVIYVRGLYLFAGRERVAKLSTVGAQWTHVGRMDSWPVVRILPASAIADVPGTSASLPPAIRQGLD
jgi:hypothetical protein